MTPCSRRMLAALDDQWCGPCREPRSRTGVPPARAAPPAHPCAQAPAVLAGFPPRRPRSLPLMSGTHPTAPLVRPWRPAPSRTRQASTLPPAPACCGQTTILGRGRRRGRNPSRATQGSVGNLEQRSPPLPEPPRVSSLPTSRSTQDSKTLADDLRPTRAEPRAVPDLRHSKSGLRGNP